MSRLKSSMLIGLIVLLVALPSCVELAEDQPTPTPIPTPSESNKPTYEVRKGSIVQTVKALGRVAASQEAVLFFKQAGRMRRLYVDTNQQVKTGDVLAELETGNLRTQIDQAKINLEIAQIRLSQATEKAGTGNTALSQAQATLNKAESDLIKAQAALDALKAGPLAADLRAAEQGVAAADAGLANAQNNRTKAYDAYTKKQITWAEYQATVKAVTSATAALTSARAKLNALKAGAKASDISAAEKALEGAKAALDSAKANYDNVVATQSRGGDYDVQIQQKQVELSRVSLQVLEDQLELAQIKAPFDGAVLQVAGRDGDEVKAYTAVVTIANPKTIQVAVELQPADLTKVQLKQKAQIVFTNFPTDKIEGTVVYLPSLSAGTDTQLAAAQRTVRIDFTPMAGRSLELGSLANVTVNTQVKDDVLILPNTAIRTFGGRKFVRLAAVGARTQEVDIEVGLSNETETEIVKGLKEGQLVVGQ